MVPKLADSAAALSIALPTLDRLGAESARRIAEAKDWLEERFVHARGQADVMALGSLARLESTSASDFDYLVVMHRLPDNVRLGRDLIDAGKDLGELLRMKPPGRTGMFARVVSAPDLTENIGLEDDTNLMHSLRILTIEESVSIFDSECVVRSYEPSSSGTYST